MSESELQSAPRTTQSLLGCVTVKLVADEDAGRIFGDTFKIYSYAWASDLVNEKTMDLCARDARWQMFNAARRTPPPENAVLIKYDGYALRFKAPDGEPIEPLLTHCDADEKHTEKNPEWIDAAFEADIYCLGEPEYFLNRNDTRLASKFNPNGASFFVVMRKRT